MSLQAILFNLLATHSDKKRDAAIPLPIHVECCRDIPYGPQGREQLLDIYYPTAAQGQLPTIVSVHGGGYVYGNKEIYRRYCMDLARRGFAVVNFNYRLAPRVRFPGPLEDTNRVLTWLLENAAPYHLDPHRVFLVGDSAGAQIVSQYAAIWSNPGYAAHFDFTVPPVKLLALGLNCGMYDARSFCGEKPTGLARDYMGPRVDLSDPRLDVLEAVTAVYPPASITTACHDFLRSCAQPMQAHLQSRGVEAALTCYGSDGDRATGHVFHINILTAEALRCNDDQCAFFHRFL